ncbi:MAG: peptidylprolyl isomerase [Candidatus Omnitrophota bacterium]
MKREIGFFTSVALLGVFLAVSGCGRAADSRTVLVLIGDTKITVSDFNERVAKLPAKYRDIVKKREEEYLQELINDTLLYQEAVRKSLHKDKDVQGVIEEARKKILIARLLKDEVDDAITITQEDVEEFYASNKNRYMTPEIMRVSHILVPSREEAEDILAELAKGTSFEDLARAKSVDPTAQRGGDIGYFPKGQLMPEFENGCAQLEIDETSGVVKTKLGYHIIKLTDRRQPALRPVGQVSDDIESRLRTINRQKIFNELIGRLREETTVKINEEALSRPKEGNR